MLKANAKVWKTLDGELVPDGHEDAAVLVARKGEFVPDKAPTLVGAVGVELFFDTVTPGAEVAPVVADEEENENEEQPPKPAPAPKPKKKKAGAA